MEQPSSRRPVKRDPRHRSVTMAVVTVVVTIVAGGVGLRSLADGGPVRSLEATEPAPTPADKGIFSGMGGWIAYGDVYRDGYTYGARSGLWAMDPARPGIRKQLSTQSGEPLAWSSDGSKLLILSLSGQGATADESLSVLNADGSETLLIDAGVGHGFTGGSFSPDGSKVVYGSVDFDGSAPDGIYVIDAVGGTPRLLLKAPPAPAYGRKARWGLIAPSFSPDGSQIAYIEGMGDHDNSLKVMNADGSGSRILLKDHGVMRHSAFAGGLVWSPDGSRLALGFGYGPDTIHVVGADGSGLRRLIAHGADPQWSPDGSRIAYDKSDWEPVLRIADADGTHVQRFSYAGSGPWNPLDPP